MFYHFRIHKEKSGYWAECLELEGCRTQGDTLAELKVNATEALELYLSEPEGSKVVFPLPRPLGRESKTMFCVKASPQTMLSVLLRYHRRAKGLTLKQVAEMIGFKSLNAYRKLESAKTCNPELKTLAKLKAVFPDMDVDDVLE